jgi:hypothetical protein
MIAERNVASCEARVSSQRSEVSTGQISPSKRIPSSGLLVTFADGGTTRLTIRSRGQCREGQEKT